MFLLSLQIKERDLFLDLLSKVQVIIEQVIVYVCIGRYIVHVLVYECLMYSSHEPDLTDACLS